MKHEDKKNHQHTRSCCSGSSSPEIESKTCCSFSSEAASTEEPSSCGTKSHEHSHSCCSDTIALTTDKGQHSCCSDHDIVSGDSDIEETAEYRVYGMDCPSCAATIEKSLKTLNDIQHVTLNYNTGKLQVAAASESALLLIPSSVEKLGFNIETIQSNKKMKTYLIEGMDCAACANTIVNHLKTVPAVKDVRVNFSTGKAQIEHDNEADDIIKEVSKAGYTATLVTSSRQSAESRHHKGQNGPIVFSGILIALGFIGSHTGIASYMTTVLYAIAMIVSGYKPAKSAYYGIKSRSLDMNVLMTVAALGAAVIGEWLEGATVVWLFALGVALQTRSIEQTRNSIRGLMDLAPSEAWVKENGQLIKKAAEDISIGTTIVVKPGDRIPLDGEIINGESSINQAPITGESIPVDKIIHLVQEAQEKKAPTQSFFDKFATIYTPIVFILALFIMVIPPLFDGAWSEWFYKGLELLVVACPCALVISTPVAIVSAIGNAAKNGVLIKGGTFLEKAGAINAIAFDKTGTLTEGKPAVSEVVSLAAEENQLLAITKTLEDYSNHPIARAIVDYAAEKKVDSLQGSNFKILTGKGVQATIQETVYYAGNAKLFSDLGTPLSHCWSHIEKLQNEGKTIIIVGTAKSVLGIISVADTIRHTTVSALESLKQNGMQQIVMLTGDNEGTAKMIASESRVDRYFADLLPEDKVKAIQQLQHEGYQTAMVGDGINDAPALATADLGIAMGGAGTDTAMETADIVLMADNLEKLPHTMKLSRKALAVIKQNIWFSIIVKVIALAFIFPGWLTLWIAVLSDTGAALLVILNSLRLLKMKK